MIGAARRSQGTGPFLARALRQAGCELVGVAGRSVESARQAAAALPEIKGPGEAPIWGRLPEAFASVPAMMAATRPDIVAIASPTPLHRQHLQEALDGGAHVLCEKPLVWEEGLEGRADDGSVAALARAFSRSESLLDLNAQWPQTLPFYRRLFPEVAARPARLSMRLSPMYRGLRVVVDSAPHLISMLAALFGPGAVEGARSVWERGECERLTQSFVYCYSGGECAVDFSLEETPKQPRPAWYALDHRRAERFIELPEYRLGLADGARRLLIKDPLYEKVFGFVDDVREQKRTDVDAVIGDHRALVALVRSAASAL